MHPPACEIRGEDYKVVWASASPSTWWSRWRNPGRVDPQYHKGEGRGGFQKLADVSSPRDLLLSLLSGTEGQSSERSDLYIFVYVNIPAIH